MPCVGETQYRPCRVVGLTSEKGKRLNGTAAEAPFNVARNLSERISVFVETEPEPLSLKRENVEFFPNGTLLDGGVGVGRGSIRDATFQATAADNEFGRKLSGEIISGPCARARGNLMAAKTIMKSFRSLGHRGAVIMCTDLNISRAIDLVVSGKTDLELPPPLTDSFREVKKLLRKEMKKESFIIANYRPHRIEPDGPDKSMRRAQERYAAVQSGTVSSVYPCLFENYRDAMEVRYFAEISSGNIIVRHETYLDYGPEEAVTYVKVASALGEVDRLDPACLASIDPQAFWSAIAHIDEFYPAIQTLNNGLLDEKWRGVVAGLKKGKMMWQDVASESNIKLSPAILAGEDSSWFMQSKEEHERVASGCANIALLMMASSVDSEASLTVDVLDFYRGTQIANLATAISSAGNNKGDRASSIKASFEKAGYGNGTYVSTDPLESCLSCGKIPEDIKMCSRCSGAAFCNSECQRACWKAHKKECNVQFAHIRQSVLYLAKKHGVTLEPRNSDGAGSESCLFSETSGAGSVGIMWNPGSISFITFTDTNATSGSRPSVDMNDVIQFQELSELVAPVRFLLACGPVCDIDVARACVDEVISMTGGKIDKLRMKMANFSPLEWAAKKGNTEIVEWLCTDDRTKCLINEGCPVGWACYTGKVDVARKLVQHGADSTKTDYTLFYNCPPLLVAAENGQVEAMEFLVDEMGHDIHMVGPTGRDLLKSIMVPPNWMEVPGHRKAYRWAKERLG